MPAQPQPGAHRDVPDPVARARALGPALDAAADEIERTRRIPEPLLSELHASRLFRLLLPAALGGDEVAPTLYVAALEAIARHDASVAWNMFVGNSSALIGAVLPVDTAHAIFDNPRSLIAWGPPLPVRCRAAPGGYRVTGRWDFCSGCRQANWMGAHCLVEEPDGTLRLNRFGRPTMRTLLFPVEQCTLLDTWDTIGLRGTASDSFEVDDVFVAEAFSTTREDPALRLHPGRLYAFTHPGLYAVGVAGVALGIAAAMLDAFLALAAGKAPRGLKRLADDPEVQSDAARWRAKLGAARAYVTATVGGLYEAADAAAPLDVADRARLRLACTHAIHAAIAVADHAYKAAGVDAIYPAGPFHRRFRDIHTLSQQIQSRDAHYSAVGSVLLGVPPAVFL